MKKIEVYMDDVDFANYLIVREDILKKFSNLNNSIPLTKNISESDVINILVQNEIKKKLRDL